MSPLRRWMTSHRLPAWYSWVVVVMLPIMASMGVLVISLRINERTIDRETAARLASEHVLCQVFVVLDDAYSHAAPKTAAGKQLAAAVHAVRITNCGQPR